MRYPFVAGNWKMYKTTAEARKFANEFKKIYEPSDVKVAICAPFTSLAALAEELSGSGIALGAQNGRNRNEYLYLHNALRFCNRIIVFLLHDWLRAYFVTHGLSPFVLC